MKIKGILILIAVVFLLAACGANKPSTDADKLSSDQVKELVHQYSVGEFKDVSASITSDELVVTDKSQNKTVYELPNDQFFVSIAPFVNQTHPCAVHSLTGCQGELVLEEFDVLIEDEKGAVIKDETMQSFANGFIDVWLPRDQKFNVTIIKDGKKAVSQLSTFQGDNTCVTTMQLL